MRVAARYQFTDRWEIAAPARTVFEILRAVEDYPKWWLDFKTVQASGVGSYDMSLRSFMRYTLTYTLLQSSVNKSSLVLVGKVEGDLVGTIRWDVDPAPGGCVAHFTQEVSARHWLVNKLSPVIRGVFRWNHVKVMRNGERALRMHLAKTTTSATRPP